ncbi:MAG: DUF599 domain-containing protein [Gammaproteobacteria bacterium]|nr:DUF599 domain-containing protein [Gammaproteobacteria bacterium]
MSEIPLTDILSLLWFMLVWIGYTWYADYVAHRRRSLRAVMHAHRYRWMLQMLTRENRMTDVNILHTLQQSVSFFASATLLIIAGLLTILGSSDRAIEVVRALPFAATSSLVQWELKLLVLSFIFVYAFFKFTWSLRQFNYCAVLIGAAPAVKDKEYARRAADVSTNASKDFNQGLRAYYLSLATLAWFISPWMFMVATTLVAIIMYLREYHSATMEMLEPSASE